ncbi:MAG: DNA repair protein RadC [Nanoarchaeota archaeon]|nr:DNA repair protein RadC [Nanoarchaeota archaeon]
MNIKTLPSEERPREKLLKHGARSLTNSELLAIILRTGNKKENVLELSNKFFTKYNLKSLSRLKTSTLKKQLGIGDAKACQIMACFELGKRLSAFKEEIKPQIKSAKDIANIFIPKMNSLEKEHFIGVYLDSRRRIIKQETIFIGSLNESIVHPREIFKIAIEENAAAIIILHNHPSGDSTPSSFDIKITKELIKAGELLGIQILDHIIIGGGKFVSLKEEEMI